MGNASCNNRKRTTHRGETPYVLVLVCVTVHIKTKRRGSGTDKTPPLPSTPSLCVSVHSPDTVCKSMRMQKRPQEFQCH